MKVRHGKAFYKARRRVARESRHCNQRDIAARKSCSPAPLHLIATPLASFVSLHLTCLAIGTGETVSTSRVSLLRLAASTGCLATSTGDIQVAAVSPFILTTSSTCRNVSDTTMHAGRIGWGYVEKQTQLENSLKRDLYWK